LLRGLTAQYDDCAVTLSGCIGMNRSKENPDARSDAHGHLV
jgi:hypothetical protein